MQRKNRLFDDLFYLVPETGLEPARLAAYAPKAYVYTNFTTRAYGYYNTKRRLLLAVFFII